MAIKRPESRAAGPQEKNNADGEAVAVSVLIDKKKKSLARSSTKSTGKKSQKSSKRSSKSKKPDCSYCARRKDGQLCKRHASPAPSLPKNEREWIDHIKEMKVGDLLTFMESNTGKLNVTALTVVQKLSEDLSRHTSGIPTDYNGWLDFFSSMTPAETEQFMEAHFLSLGNESSAAGKRWLNIADNPAQIDRIVQGRLQQKKKEEIGNILTAARSRNRIETFEALRDNIAYKLEDGSGARDMTVLIKQLNEVMSTLDELYREAGVKDDSNSSIRRLLVRSRKMASRPRARQAAATIEDVEEEGDDDE